MTLIDRTAHNGGHPERPKRSAAPGRPGRRPGNSRRRRSRGIIIAIAALVLAAAIAGHRFIPETGGLGLVWESALPWAWVLVAALAVLALFRRSLVAGAGVLVAALTWSALFLPGLPFQGQPMPADADTSAGGKSTELVVATHNVGARLPQPTATANSLIDSGADIVSVQELAGKSGGIIGERLTAAYRYHKIVGTVGLWSRYPISDVTRQDLGMDWTRAFSATVTTPAGDVRVYAAHLPSVRPGAESARNDALERLASTVAADDAERIILAGDLNTAATDRHLVALTDQLTDTSMSKAGDFGFTWPSKAPVTRPDHVMVKGIDVVSDQVLPSISSDHRAVIARVALPQG
ncbi:endonuclease/exonuclease/phosphatase family protein [Saxibacter everestensis]|uniref:Endonuclease/exonuclease/phosphatase family protein n=1 Tax=Saxibacter everestensis TaxID=2909229 RepID=A0ABY8QQL6_9MICO|nr:endonuclease/exonuclease/phosphatase family protein [Brevibacteriaceae bacterium ZFBP1038]